MQHSHSALWPPSCLVKHVHGPPSFSVAALWHCSSRDYCDEEDCGLIKVSSRSQSSSSLATLQSITNNSVYTFTFTVCACVWLRSFPWTWSVGPWSYFSPGLPVQMVMRWPGSCMPVHRQWGCLNRYMHSKYCTCDFHRYQTTRSSPLLMGNSYHLCRWW